MVVTILNLFLFARVSRHMTDCNVRNKILTAELLQQGYRYHKLRKTFSKLYRRRYGLVFIFSIGLKSLSQQGLLEPKFYSGLVYKLKKNVVSTANFSDQFRKAIIRCCVVVLRSW